MKLYQYAGVLLCFQAIKDKNLCTSQYLQVGQGKIWREPIGANENFSLFYQKTKTHLFTYTDLNPLFLEKHQGSGSIFFKKKLNTYMYVPV